MSKEIKKVFLNKKRNDETLGINSKGNDYFISSINRIKKLVL